MTDRFPICFPFVLVQECPEPNDWSNAKNFTDEKGDPGRGTMCGITQAVYNAYRKSHGQTIQSVRYCTEVEGNDIYRTLYWQPHACLMKAGLDLQMFDATVNMGQGEAVKILQVILDITEDGIWGPETALAVKGIINVPRTISNFTRRRKVAYRMMPDYKLFGTDWERRATQIGSEALKMA